MIISQEKITIEFNKIDIVIIMLLNTIHLSLLMKLLFYIYLNKGVISLILKFLNKILKIIAI